MATERVIFSDAIEGFFFRALGPRLTPNAKARLRAAGLDLDQKLAAQYPLERFREFVEIARQEAFPHLPREEAHRQMGDLMISGYGQTMLGRTMLSLLKLLGVQRSMRRLDSNLRAVNNFTQTKFTPLGDLAVEYWINDLAISKEFTMGLIVAGMRASGADTVQTQALTDRGEGYTFRIDWTEKRR